MQTKQTFTSTILWSTQGGRAKACARRTSRILRDYLYYNCSNDNNNNNNSNSANSTYTSALEDHYYGTSFDDFGAAQFLNLGRLEENDHDHEHEHEHDHEQKDEVKDEEQNDEKITMVPKEKVSSTNKKKTLIIMFVSTTGDAEHCDCIRDTWRVL